MQQLTDNVWLVTGEGRGRYPDANGLLVRGEDQTLLIDAPLGLLNGVGTELGASLPMPDLVVLSHCHEDHIPGLAHPALSSLPLWVHALDKSGLDSLDDFMALFGMAEPFLSRWRTVVCDRFHYQPRPDAQPFADGHSWDLGGVTVQAIHTPGHTAGHCALRIEPDEVVFLGDLDLSGFGPYYGDAVSSLVDFERTLDQIAPWKARWFVTGHHIGAVDQATFEHRLPKYKDRIRQREEQLIAFLKEPRSLDELIRHRFIYRPTDQVDGADWIERRSITLHLERLEQAGIVTRGLSSSDAAGSAEGSKAPTDQKGSGSEEASEHRWAVTGR